MSEDPPSNDYLVTGSVPIVGQTKKQVIDALDKLTGIRSMVNYFSYPSTFNGARTDLDFSTLRNLVLMGGVPTLEALIKCIADIFLPFLKGEDEKQVQEAEEIFKSALKELRRVRGLERLGKTLCLQTAELPDVQPSAPTDYDNYVVPDDAWHIVDNAVTELKDEQRLKKLTTKDNGSLLLLFTNEKALEAVRELE